MPALSTSAFALLELGELTRHDVHLAMIFLGIIAFSLLTAAAGLLVGGMFAYKLFIRVDGIAHLIEHKTGPILDRTTQILSDLTPKVQSISENAEQLSYTIRTTVDQLAVTVCQLNETVAEINGRTRIQVSRVDGIVTDALIATEEIAANVQQSIKAPVRQIAGVIAGLKAGLETLIARSPFGR
jgi:uncharacterized protein YoxC